MGTWAAGPFENDAALDFVDGIGSNLSDALESFARTPQIDEGFDTAFAAVGLFNLLAAGATPLGLKAGSPVAQPTPDDARRWRSVMLKCFDEQIEGLSPAQGFVEEQRAALVEHLDRLVANAEAFHA